MHTAPSTYMTMPVSNVSSRKEPVGCVRKLTSRACLNRVASVAQFAAIPTPCFFFLSHGELSFQSIRNALYAGYDERRVELRQGSTVLCLLLFPLWALLKKKDTIRSIKEAQF
ncbi:hypothetical protein F4815DRAFT_481990 [Daldinia loculata]|nr:hypothetical protein F4815DRAFT_481990 [Daldinia loculata]